MTFTPRSPRARQELLARVNQLINVSLERGAPVGVLVSCMYRSLAEWCGVALVDERTGELELVGSTEGSEMPDAIRLALEPEGEASEVYETRAPVWSDSAIIVPLLAREKSVGVLLLATASSQRRFDAADLDEAIALASHAGLAIENARAYRALERSERRQRALADFCYQALSEPVEALQMAAERLLRSELDLQDGEVHFDLSGSERGSIVPRSDEDLVRELVVPIPGAGACTLRTREPRRYFAGELDALRQIANILGKAMAHERSLAERLRYEAELQRSGEQKDRFLAMLGHELRNPLATIQSAVQLMRILPDEDPRTERARAVVQRQVSHMARLMDDLLDMSRISSGRIVLRCKVFDLNTIIDQAVTDYVENAAAKGVILRHEPRSLPLWVNADKDRILQVLGNLFSNALKFTEPGDRITVRLERDGENACLTLADTGIGMASEVVRNVFEPLLQADTSLGRESGGLGLGLSVARGLIELHGGTIAAASGGLGQGSTFVVRLPLSAPPSRASVPTTGPGAKLPGMRILLVEDNTDSAELLQGYLDATGAEVEVTFDGESALRVVSRVAPHAVLCDIGLPGRLSGYDVASALRAMPQTHDLLLIAVTGYGSPEDRRRALEAGFDRHMTKPVNIPALSDLLQEHYHRMKW